MARYQAFLQQSSLSDEGEPVPFLDQGLHLRWMRCTRVVLQRDAGMAQQFQQARMRLGMALWVVNNCEVALQVGYLEHGFAGERMILAKADHKPVAAQLFHMEIGMPERQSDDRCLNHAFKNFFR